MGFASQEGHIGFKRQATNDFPGAYLDPRTAGVFIRHLSGGLSANRDLIIPDPEIGGNRDIPAAILGPVSFAGDVEFYVRMNMLTTLLHAALGDRTTTADTDEDDNTVAGANKHVITPIDSVLSMPLLSVEESIADDLDSFQYTDVRINTINLECEPGGIFMGTAGFIGRAQQAIADPGAPPAALVDTTPLSVGTAMNITIDDESYCARDMSIEFTNNVEDDVYCLGNVFLADLTPKRREMTASFTIRPNDKAKARALFRAANYGLDTATSPLASGGAFTAPITIDIETAQDIPGAPVNTKYHLRVEVPQAVMEPFPLEPSNDDVIEYSVDLQAIRPDNAQPLCTFTVVNELTDADVA